MRKGVKKAVPKSVALPLLKKAVPKSVALVFNTK